ncbi:hypothetical protein JCM15765_14610 [Paradesulfitobacterium aromaticivorans]
MIPLKNHRITYPYGVKNTRYIKGYHTGVDMASGDYNIHAACPGTVIQARYAPGKGADPSGWGNYVILRSADGQHDLIHAHLSSVAVSAGQTVSEGAVLGIMGSTGQSTGPHLHFEVRKAPWENRNDVDPMKFLEGLESEVIDVDNLVIYADGDVGAALLLSYKLGCPMVLKDFAGKYQAKNKHWIGVQGTNGNGNFYYAGSDRIATAKLGL